jgi:hypothetical protein
MIGCIYLVGYSQRTAMRAKCRNANQIPTTSLVPELTVNTDTLLLRTICWHVKNNVTTGRMSREPHEL